ncbi:MAG: RHS repeat-associated core domain-containing protein [Firmicutes bacterium]|nr:RHS repeat-associated core domain-containing protein [Bacillota bacterium]
MDSYTLTFSCSESEVLEEGLRFTGKETDRGTGLVYFGARYYDPEVGRWTTVDPAGDGMNWYAYCNNNPLIYIDTTGKAPFNVQKEGYVILPIICIVGDHESSMALPIYTHVRVDYLAKMTVDVKDQKMVVKTTIATSAYSIDPLSGYKMAVMINAAIGVYDDMGTQWNIFDDKTIYSRSFLVGATMTTPFGCGDGFYDVDRTVVYGISIPNETNDLHADLLTINLSLSVSMFSYEQTALAWDWEASDIILSLSIDEPGGLDYADESFEEHW